MAANDWKESFFLKSNYKKVALKLLFNDSFSIVLKLSLSCLADYLGLAVLSLELRSDVKNNVEGQRKKINNISNQVALNLDLPFIVQASHRNLI